jgi:hypothetical protein
MWNAQSHQIWQKSRPVAFNLASDTYIPISSQQALPLSLSNESVDKSCKFVSIVVDRTASPLQQLPLGLSCDKDAIVRGEQCDSAYNAEITVVRNDLAHAGGS